MAKPAEIAADGWVSVEVDDDLDLHLHLTNRVGEIVLDGLYLHGAEITTDTFRRVHPGRVLAALWEHIYSASPDSAAGAEAWAAKKGISFTQSLNPWVGRRASDAQTTIGDLRSRAEGHRIVERARAPLGRPDDAGDLDGFYRRLAEAYMSAGAASGRPAQVLAEENGVPVNTVHRWVKEARRRGHLPPGRRRRAD